MRAVLNVRSAKRQVAILVLPTITLGIKVISALAARVFMIVNNRHARYVNCCKCAQGHLCSSHPSLLSLHLTCRTIKKPLNVRPKAITTLVKLCAVCAHSNSGHTILR